MQQRKEIVKKISIFLLATIIGGTIGAVVLTALKGSSNAVIFCYVIAVIIAGAILLNKKTVFHKK